MSSFDEIFLTPTELARRWHFHPESIRRKIRLRQIASVVIGRRRLIRFSEVLRMETAGEIKSADSERVN